MILPKYLFKCLFIRAFQALVVLLIFKFSAFSQATNIKFKHISIKEGLSQSTINAMAQDEMGFMWFATQDGLNRYDGYEFTTYKHEVEDSNTISNGFVNCFYKDYKGNLWIGTNSGVNIFNHSANNFIHIESHFPSLSKLKDQLIVALSKGEDSSIFICTQETLYEIKPGKELISINPEILNKVEIKNFRISDLLLINDSTLWVSSKGHGILEFNLNNRKFNRISAEGTGSISGLSSNNINTLFKATNGLIYVGSDFGLNIFNPQTQKFNTFIYNVSDPFSISSNFITDIFEDHLGNLWIATNGGGLNKFDKNRSAFYSYKKNINNSSSIISNDVSSIFQDNTGVMWVGTSVGLSKFDILKQNFNHFEFDQSSISTISRNIVWSILSEGEDVWVGSNEGLNRFQRNLNINEPYVPSIYVNNERRANAIYAIERIDQNNLLVGTDGGVLQFNTMTNTFSVPYFSGKRVSNRTYNFFKDSKNRLWISTRDGLFLYNNNSNYFREFRQGDGLPGNTIRTVFESSDNTIWIGTDNGLCKLDETNGVFSFKIFEFEKGNPNSLRNNTVLCMAEDNNGFLWIGTFGGGLNRYDPKGNQFLSFTEKDGLPNNVIYGILIDEKNNLWCSTNRGLTRFNPENKSVRNFDEDDGLQSNEFNLGAYHKDESGELFFGGIKGVNSFFSSQIQLNTLSPLIVITDFQLFNKSVEVGPESPLKQSVSVTEKIILNHSQNVFTFSFAALHYSLPERNRYAYKLEGFDPHWTFDDNARRAKYTNLDPGIYTFKVKGTNSDGFWSEESHLVIEIRPPFWQILWIQILAILAFLGMIYFFYRNRLRTIEIQKEKLEKEVLLRTIEVNEQKEEIEKQKLLLEEEKEKLETLLLNVLPESTVEELKSKGKATARNYNKVSVMFTDFKGFTKISENLKPTELVTKLDAFFVKFDGVIEKYNVEKIKTIGDAYMCAGGIPIRNKSNPVDVVLAGLEIQRVMIEFNAELKENGEPEWGLRLGIHTGIIIAGVIGVKRFAYDIWGDTVNVASRIETNGEVGKVNVSEATYEQIKDYFNCEYRGKINAKNKGDIDMYFVNSIKPHLSIDGKGIEPNDKFWEYVNLNLFSPIDYHKAEENILNKLKIQLPSDLRYHNVNHTIGVTEAVERIALNEGIHNEDLYALKMAALYHDAGFIDKYQNNETVGARMAREDLPEFGFSDEQIGVIEKLIMVTFATKKPNTLLECILRDADLDYLGREDFHEVSECLRQELIERKMISPEEIWDELQVKFLENHEYYTESARNDRNKMKAKHLQEIKDRLLKNEKIN